MRLLFKGRKLVDLIVMIQFASCSISYFDHVVDPESLMSKIFFALLKY